MNQKIKQAVKDQLKNGIGKSSFTVWLHNKGILSSEFSSILKELPQLSGYSYRASYEINGYIYTIELTQPK